MKCSLAEKGKTMSEPKRLAWTAKKVSENKSQAQLDKLDVSIIRGLADNGMNITRTARAMFVHRNTVRFRIERVKKKTNIDPIDFYGLCKLLMLAGQIEKQEDEQCK